MVDVVYKIQVKVGSHLLSDLFRNLAAELDSLNQVFGNLQMQKGCHCSKQIRTLQQDSGL